MAKCSNLNGHILFQLSFPQIPLNDYAYKLGKICAFDRLFSIAVIISADSSLLIP